MSAHPASKEVFLSYAETDEKLALELEKHLSVLKREGLITTWHKGQIGVGTDRNKEMSERLSTASIILLLLSANFVASDACYSIEMQRAVERHNAGEVCVIPVALRPMDTLQNTPFGGLVALPSTGVPVTRWVDEHAAFADVARGIRLILQGGTLTPAIIAPLPLPSIWNIPYPRNPVFTGREEILQHIESQLQAGQAMALSQAQAISGLGGIGKTQIAVEFAYRHCDEYQAVLWVLSDTRESLVSGFIALAGLLNLPEKEAKEQEITIEAMKSWLQTHGSWLLILDNADDLAIVREFIPATFGGHLLLTTRAWATGKLAKRIEVEAMTQDTGALLLLRLVGLVKQDAPLGSASVNDVAIACSISEELGGLPLALDQAGAFIEEAQCSLQDYREQYRRRRALLLQRRGGVVSDHPEPVATTWSLSFEKVEKKSAIAADLLRLCAFLYPDAIPIELVIKGARHLGPSLALVAEDDLALDEAIVIVGAYSLIRREAKERTLSIHRLVQAVQRDTMNKQTAGDWMHRVIQALNKVFPEVEFKEWTTCGRLLPHVQLSAIWIADELTPPLEASHLLRKAGMYLQERGQYRDAEFLVVRALAIHEQKLGEMHLDTAQSLNNLGVLYALQGKYEQAEPLFLRVLSIRERKLGSEHPDTAKSLNNLAELYRSQGKYEQAEPLYLRALLVNEQHLGFEHSNTAQSLNNLALLYWQQGKYEQAEPLYLHALAIREQKLGEVHPSTAASLNNLGVLYKNQGKYEQAEPLYERALVICEQQLGGEHPDTARSLNNLANLYQDQRKYEQAEPLYERALVICERQLGGEHPDTARSLNNLAELYQHQGKYEQAEPLYERALVICEQQLGGEHPDTARSLNNLASLYQHQRKYEQAEPLYERALAIREQRLGPAHPDTRETRKAYTAFLRTMGRGEEADLLEA